MSPNLERLIISSKANTWNILQSNRKPSKTYLKEEEKTVVSIMKFSIGLENLVWAFSNIYLSNISAVKTSEGIKKQQLPKVIPLVQHLPKNHLELHIQSSPTAHLNPFNHNLFPIATKYHNNI